MIIRADYHIIFLFYQVIRSFDLIIFLFEKISLIGNQFVSDSAHV